MDNITLLTYTHSKTVALHEPYFGRIKKYFPGLQNNLVTCNVPVDFAECILYDDTHSHSSQMVQALEYVKTDYVIYSQEDYVLFDYVQEDKLVKYTTLLSKDPVIHFIRLIKSGVGPTFKAYNEELAYINPFNDYYFSTQITLWKRDVLKEMYRKSKVVSIFDEPANSIYLRDLGAVGLYTTKVGAPVGGHYNSIVYPYIATAKVKGKWNIEEYPNELAILFDEYNITR